MTIKSFNRGYAIYYDDEKRDWFYCDDNSSANIDRPCKRCGGKANRYGHDYCMKNLTGCEGIISACCGHGVEKGYIMLKDGRVFEERW